MYQMKALELKPLETDNPDSLRIYNYTKEACERLNNYLLDFVETIAILKEKKMKFLENENGSDDDATAETIASVEEKITQVIQSMEKIADDMSYLVDLKELEAPFGKN